MRMLTCRNFEVKTLAQRLNWAMEKKGIKQAALAEQVGTSQPTINKLLLGKIEDTSLIVPISNVLSINPNWLQFGKGSPEPTMNVTNVLKDHSIPLIDWSNIDQILKVCLNDGDIKEVPYIEELPLIFDDNNLLNKYCIGLIVRGNAMAPDKNEGDTIVVNPLITPSSKDSVIFKSLDDEEGVYKLRQYIQEEDGKFYLRANNKEYPQIAITKNIKIGGVVVYTIKRG